MKALHSTYVAAALVLALSACSTPDKLAVTPALEPQFGTRGYDAVEDIAYGRAGLLYAVGTLNSTNVREGFASAINQDGFVRRFDRNGNLVWEDYLDIEPVYASDQYIPALYARAVTVDSGGNAFVAWSGEYREYTYDPSSGRAGYVLVGSFHYLTKYNPAGTKLWRVYTTSALTDLAVDSSGNVYGTSEAALTKYAASGARVWTKAQPVTPSGVTVSSTNTIYTVREDGVVVKYNAGGTQLWLRTGQLDGTAYEDFYGGSVPYRIVAGLSDELYLTVTRFDNTTTACDEGLSFDHYTMRAYKLSNTGIRQWVRNVAIGTFAYGQDCAGDYYDSLTGLGIAADTNGNVYIAGYQDGADQDGFVAKYSRAGALAWKRTFVTFKDDAATSVASYDGSEVFMGGVTKGNLAHRQLGGGGDAVMRELDSNGERIWSR